MPITAARRAKLYHQLELDDCQWIATDDSILVPAQRSVVLTIGIELKSQGQGWSHNWRATHGRTVRLRKRTAHALDIVSVVQVMTYLNATVRSIAFVRMAPRRLDTDNLVAAFKPIRDQVCCWLRGNNAFNARADDGVRSGYTFDYHQQPQRVYGVRVELSP